MAGEGLLRSSRPTLRFDAAKRGGGWVGDFREVAEALALYVCVCVLRDPRASETERDRQRRTNGRTNERTNERKVEGELAKLVQRV